MGGWTATASRTSGSTSSVSAPTPTGRVDWYWIPEEMLVKFGGAPGVIWDKQDRPMAHVSLLRLAGFQAPSTAAVRADANGEWKLRDYQKVGRDFIASRRGTLLGDMMRMGKTAQVLFAHDPADGPLIVAGPLASRDSVWMTWFNRLWPERKAVFLTGRAYDRAAIDDADLFFVHYDVLPAWQSLVRRKPAMLVLDEAHVLSNRAAERTRAAQTLAVSAGRVVAVTGTPLWNRPAGLFQLLTCVTPGAFGGFKEFSERYADGKPGSHGWSARGATHVEEFKERLKSIMIRRTWSDVRDELPPVDRAVVPVDLSEKQVRKLDLLSEQVRQSSKSTKRTQIGELARYRRLTGMLKVEAAVDLAKNILESGESVVLWTWHKDIAREIQKYIPGSFLADGDSSNTEREVAFAAWRSKTPQALILTMAIGQTALDLSTARHAIFVEVDFTPAVVAQAEMRTFSPDKPMVVHYLYADHAVDRKLIGALVEKCRIANEIGTPAADSAIDVLSTAFESDFGSSDLGELKLALEKME